MELGQLGLDGKKAAWPEPTSSSYITKLHMDLVHSFVHIPVSYAGCSVSVTGSLVTGIVTTLVLDACCFCRSFKPYWRTMKDLALSLGILGRRQLWQDRSRKGF